MIEHLIYNRSIVQSIHMKPQSPDTDERLESGSALLAFAYTHRFEYDSCFCIAIKLLDNKYNFNTCRKNLQFTGFIFSVQNCSKRQKQPAILLSQMVD